MSVKNYFLGKRRKTAKKEKRGRGNARRGVGGMTQSCSLRVGKKKNKYLLRENKKESKMDFFFF